MNIKKASIGLLLSVNSFSVFGVMNCPDAVGFWKGYYTVFRIVDGRPSTRTGIRCNLKILSDGTLHTENVRCYPYLISGSVNSTAKCKVTATVNSERGNFTFAAFVDTGIQSGTVMTGTGRTILSGQVTEEYSFTFVKVSNGD
jgi:hypothetical protein